MDALPPNFWDKRRCFLPPPDDINHAVEHLTLAAKAHDQADYEAAAHQIKCADIQVLEDWRYLISGPSNQKIHRIRPATDIPPLLPKNNRLKARMPLANAQSKLIQKYGYHCTYCDVPLIDLKTFKRMKKKYPNAARWGSINTEKHHALKAMSLTFDHVIPHSRGGNNDIENLVISCQTCNCGKGNSTLEELGLFDPRNKERAPSQWNGLVDRFK